MVNETFTSISEERLKRMLTDAAKQGAQEALREVGLQDEEAGNDMRDLRNLIESWRTAKRTVLRTFTQWVVIFILGLITMGAWNEWK